MRLLATIVLGQRWGIGKARPDGWRLYFKGGWGDGANIPDHQVALLTYGTHRVAVAVLSTGNPRGLAWFGMPQAWLFQIVFAAISPMIDLALIVSVVGTILRVQQHGWDQTQSDVLRLAVYWAAFVSIDLLAGWIAYRLEPTRQRFPGLLMLAQRFVYRQLMYGVVIRSISAALRGRMVGWGKLERSGSVSVEAGG